VERLSHAHERGSYWSLEDRTPAVITILLNQAVFSWVFLSDPMSIAQVGYENKLGTIQNAVSVDTVTSSLVLYVADVVLPVILQCFSLIGDQMTC